MLDIFALGLLVFFLWCDILTFSADFQYQKENDFLILFHEIPNLKILFLVK